MRCISVKTSKSNLTRECFTFTKNTIYKEPEEQVRSAAFSRGRTGPRTSLQNSNESSMKSFDDVNDDICSQASSVSAAQKRSPVKRSSKKTKLDAEVSIKIDDPKLDLPSDLASPPEPADVSDIVAAEEPSMLEKTETETKEEISAEVGCGQADELDKRKAVKAAATLALRTYMNHALRTVNNPLLQSKTAKTNDKAKTLVVKSPPKNKHPQLKHQSRPTDRNPLPIVSLPKIDVTEEKVHLSSDTPKVKKVIESVRSTKPSPLTKLARIKSVPKRIVAAPENEKVHVRKTAALLRKKLPPSKLSASHAVASKESLARKESESSPNKPSKSLQNFGASPKPPKPKVVTTPTVGKINPKSDIIKSTEKPALMGEKRPPAGPVLPKPVERLVILKKNFTMLVDNLFLAPYSGSIGLCFTW